MDWPRLLAGVSDDHRDVVLKVPSDALERDGCRDAVPLQLLGIADAREHQKLRRVNDAA